MKTKIKKAVKKAVNKAKIVKSTIAYRKDKGNKKMVSTQ